MKKIYFSQLRKDLAIYNGILFLGYSGNIEGHSFYLTDDWHYGKIHYDGILYDSIPLRYDIYTDEVIVRHPNQIPIVLFGDRVKYFQYNGLQFFRLQSSDKNIPKQGFYQMLSTGKIKLIAKRGKIIEEKIESTVVLRKFITKYEYFLLKDDQYYPVKRQNAILKLLPDKRQHIIQSLKKNNIRFKTDPEKALLHIVEFYNFSRE